MIGLFLYLVLRPDAYITILVNKFIPMPVISGAGVLAAMKKAVRNYAADVLWAYALAFAVMFVLGCSKKDMQIGFLVCSGFEILIEVLQKPGVLYGTFDMLDILFEVISSGIAFMMIKRYEVAQNEKNGKNT